MKFIVFIGIIFFMFNVSVKAQAFGFGCLGFVGGYAGYSYQRYTPTGLNNYINVFNELRNDSISSPMGQFGKARGYRVGLNFFRANLEGFILTTKGFYQHLTEKNEARVNSSEGEITTSLKMDIKSWGVGLDLGTSITGALSWKVIDAALLFNSATLTSTENAPGSTEVKKYQTDASVIGYSVGTGFILEIVDEYISLEGLAGYTVFKIDNVFYNDIALPVDETTEVTMQNFIESGGFNAVIQFNIGFPL